MYETLKTILDGEICTIPVYDYKTNSLYEYNQVILKSEPDHS